MLSVHSLCGRIIPRTACAYWDNMMLNLAGITPQHADDHAMTTAPIIQGLRRQLKQKLAGLWLHSKLLRAGTSTIWDGGLYLDAKSLPRDCNRRRTAPALRDARDCQEVRRQVHLNPNLNMNPNPGTTNAGAPPRRCVRRATARRSGNRPT